MVLTHSQQTKRITDCIKKFFAILLFLFSHSNLYCFTLWSFSVHTHTQAQNRISVHSLAAHSLREKKTRRRPKEEEILTKTCSTIAFIGAERKAVCVRSFLLCSCLFTKNQHKKISPKKNTAETDRSPSRFVVMTTAHKQERKNLYFIWKLHKKRGRKLKDLFTNFFCCLLLCFFSFKRRLPCGIAAQKTFGFFGVKTHTHGFAVSRKLLLRKWKFFVEIFKLIFCEKNLKKKLRKWTKGSD